MADERDVVPSFTGAEQAVLRRIDGLLAAASGAQTHDWAKTNGFRPSAMGVSIRPRETGR